MARSLVVRSVLADLERRQRRGVAKCRWIVAVGPRCADLGFWPRRPSAFVLVRGSGPFR